MWPAKNFITIYLQLSFEMAGILFSYCHMSFIHCCFIFQTNILYGGVDGKIELWDLIVFMYKTDTLIRTSLVKVIDIPYLLAIALLMYILCNCFSNF